MADDKQVHSLAEQRLKHDLEHCQAQLKEALDGWNESAELLDRAIRERDQARAERDEFEARVGEML